MEEMNKEMTERTVREGCLDRELRIGIPELAIKLKLEG